MKTCLIKHHKHVLSMGEGKEACEEFKRSIVDAWWNGVKDSTVGAIYDSMPRRIKEVIREGGPSGTGGHFVYIIRTLPPGQKDQW